MRKLKIITTLAIAAAAAWLNAGHVESIDGDTWISETAQQACIEIGHQYGICPEFLEAIIEAESWGVPSAKNGDCKGLMQVSEYWHQDRMKRMGVADLFDERGNVLVATDYLRDLFEEYEDPAIVLGIYHGEKDVVKNAENGIVSDYTKRILERSAYLEELHERESGGVG